MFIGKNTVRVLLHWEMGFECSDRLDAAEFRCCLHYSVGCLVLFTLCQRWPALSFFLSTLIVSTHFSININSFNTLWQRWVGGEDAGAGLEHPSTASHFYLLFCSVYYYFYHFLLCPTFIILLFYLLYFLLVIAYYIKSDRTLSRRKFLLIPFLSEFRTVVRCLDN